MADGTNDTVNVPEIGPIEANERVAAGAFLLDVREDDEWQAGHTPEAYHVPLGQLVERISEIPTDRDLVVTCKGGGRSARAAAELIGRGIPATNLAGGMRGWNEASLPFIDENGQPGVVA